MNNGATAPPGYVLPSRPRWQGGWNVRALLSAVVAFVMAASAATQWLAARLHNPIEMGEPTYFTVPRMPFSLRNEPDLKSRAGTDQIDMKQLASRIFDDEVISLCVDGNHALSISPEEEIRIE